MAVNRLLYLGLLVLSAVFYFASSLWISWLLLVLLLALPVLSLLVSLPAMLSCRLETGLPQQVEQGEKAALYLRLRSWRVLPLPEVQLRLNLRTRDREKDLRYLSRLTRAEGVLALDTDHCGFLTAELRRGRVYDPLGLFCLPLRLPEPKTMVILPPALPPEPMPSLVQLLQQQTRAKPGGGAAELYDHRIYRPGDPVRDIHWKLSLKSEELVVREPLEPIHRSLVLALRTPRGPENRRENLGNLRYLSRWLLEHEAAHSLVWVEGTELRSLDIQEEQDLTQALCQACLAPEDSLELPKPLPLRADWICTVGKEGGQTP